MTADLKELARRMANEAADGAANGDVSPLGRGLLREGSEALLSSSSRIGGMETDREALHEGLRQRGMRLPSADPGADALAALDEWKGYAETAQARVAELEGALRSLIRNASILQQNSEGCAANHHGVDYGEQGLPGWLTDTAFVIEAARQALESPHG